MALGLGRLVAHPVRSFRLETLDFARARKLKTLLGAGVGLHLGHKSSI